MTTDARGQTAAVRGALLRRFARSVVPALVAVLAACGAASDGAVAPIDASPSAAAPPATAAAPGGGSTATDPAAVPTIAVAVEFDSTSGTAITAADLASTDRVYVVSTWTGPVAGRSERLDLLSPSGGVYSSTTVPLDGPAPAGVTIQTGTDGSVRVVLTLEIAGTPIDLYGMTGTWQAKASLVDGDVSGSASLLLR